MTNAFLLRVRKQGFANTKRYRYEYRERWSSYPSGRSYLVREILRLPIEELHTTAYLDPEEWRIVKQWLWCPSDDDLKPDLDIR